MNANGNNNGVGLNMNQVAESLQEEVTFGYRPNIPLESLWLTGSDTPHVTLRRDIEQMHDHPVISIAMEYYKSGIAGAEFWGGPDHVNLANDQGKPISPDPKVSQFVLAHVERFWQRGVPLLQEGYPYGWAAGEHIYKEVSGMLVWSHMKDFHPNDSYILTMNYQPIGVRVKNIREKGQTDLWLASEAIPAKACWYVHRPKFNKFYGRSQYMGAWRPWRRLAWRDGVEQVVDAAIYRAGYRGPIVRHPPGHGAGTAQQGVPATRTDGSGLARRENRDVARQLVEWAKAGAGFTMSSENYPQAQGGGRKWEIEWPDHVMDVSPLITAAGYLEDQIMLGIGVPPELVKAGGTGSGYSGRSIPREAFLEGQQRIADAMLQMFVEQVLRPLVLWNFGDIPFNVSCKSILKTQSEDKQGDQQGGMAPPPPAQTPMPGQAPPAPGMDPSMPPQMAPPPMQPQAPAPMLSLTSAIHSRVVNIVKKVLSNRAA